MKKPPTRVYCLFRTSLQTGHVYGILTEVPADPQGDFCKVYYIGEGDVLTPKAMTHNFPHSRIATPEEACVLRDRMAEAGIEVYPVLRMTRAMHLTRRMRATKPQTAIE